MLEPSPRATVPQALPPRALMLAPMVELSHRPLREIVESFGGCDRYYTEMTSAPGYLANSPYDRWFLDGSPRPDITAVQLYGSEPGPLLAAAERLARERLEQGIPLGGIDLNFGCSAPHIERTGGGVRWMKDAARAAALVDSIKRALPAIALSAKLRLGYEESATELLGFCRGLESAGADYIVIHPRLKHEKFRRTGRWEHVGELSRELSIPVIGNGDIRTTRGYREALERYGAAGVMVGREAIRRPWFFHLARAQDSNHDYALEVDIERIGLRMLELIELLLPQSFHLSRARRFFFYYCDNLSFGHHLRYAIQNASSLPDIRRLFTAYFDEVPAERTRVDR